MALSLTVYERNIDINLNEATAARRRVPCFILGAGGPITGDVANLSARISKNGTTAAGAGSLTEIDNTNLQGWYYYECTAGEVDTAGFLLLRITTATDATAIVQAIVNVRKISEAVAGDILVDPGTDKIDGSDIDQPISTRATPGDILIDPVTDKIDGSNLDVVVSTRATPGDILVDPGTDKIDGSDIDQPISSRAAPGDAMDLVADAVDAGSLATSAVDEIVDGIFDEDLTAHAIANSLAVVVKELRQRLFTASGTILAGPPAPSATTVDTDHLTGAANVYKGQVFLLLTGTAAGATAVVKTFDPATGVFEFEGSGLAAVPVAADAWVILSAQEVSGDVTATGVVDALLARVLSATPADMTVEQALLSGLADGFGKLVRSEQYLTLYTPDGVTELWQFLLSGPPNAPATAREKAP